MFLSVAVRGSFGLYFEKYLKCMYSFFIKSSSILGVVYIIFVGYLLHPIQVFASVRTEGAIEMLSISEEHVESILQYRMRGSDIKNLQEELRTLPSVYPSGKVTGYFGAATLAAVTRFQKQEHISPILPHICADMTGFPKQQERATLSGCWTKSKKFYASRMTLF